MARTIDKIHDGMLQDIASSDVLSAYLNSDSLYAIYRAFTYIISEAIFIFEGFLDIHTKNMDEKFATQKSGTLPWYRTMALNFQYGYDLVTDKDYYDNTGVSDQDIEVSKIIKYCAVEESDDESRTLIKIAGEENNELVHFTDLDKVEAVRTYFQDVKYPGKIAIINYEADQLYFNLRIKRDALVLSSNGMKKGMHGGNYPVKEALKEFMKELGFNGELVLSLLIAKLKNVPGVIDATLLSAESAWFEPTLDGYGQPGSVFISKVAVSGYYKVVTYDNIAYVV